MKLLSSLLSTPNTVLSINFSNTLCLNSSLNETEFHTHTKQWALLRLCIPVFQSLCLLEANGKTKVSRPNGSRQSPNFCLVSLLVVGFCTVKVISTPHFLPTILSALTVV